MNKTETKTNECTRCERPGPMWLDADDNFPSRYCPECSHRVYISLEGPDIEPLEVRGARHNKYEDVEGTVQSLIDKGRSIRQIAEATDLSYDTVRVGSRQYREDVGYDYYKLTTTGR